MKKFYQIQISLIHFFAIFNFSLGFIFSGCGQISSVPKTRTISSFSDTLTNNSSSTNNIIGIDNYNCPSGYNILPQTGDVSVISRQYKVCVDKNNNYSPNILIIGSPNVNKMICVYPANATSMYAGSPTMMTNSSGQVISQCSVLTSAGASFNFNSNLSFNSVYIVDQSTGSSVGNLYLTTYSYGMFR